MNLKIVLATAVLLTGGAYAADAQQKTASTQTAVTAKSFENKVKEYQEADEAKSALLFTELRKTMGSELSAVKAQIAATTNQASRDKLTAEYDKKMNLMSDVVKLKNSNSDKKDIVAALTRFGKAL